MSRHALTIRDARNCRACEANRVRAALSHPAGRFFRLPGPTPTGYIGAHGTASIDAFSRSVRLEVQNTLGGGLVMKRCVILALVMALAGPAVNLPADEAAAPAEVKTGLKVGQSAPDFKIKDADGKLIDLAQLTAQGPVLVRLTCGCSGCDKEIGYFQSLHAAYKGKGLTSIAVFKEPDAKVEKYVKEKSLDMLYAVDTDGKSWDVFQTKTMPTNFLIEKGGKIRAIAAGCDPSGLIAQNLSAKVAQLVGSSAANVQSEAPAEKK